jgi:RHS repeat-associated protein
LYLLDGLRAWKEDVQGVRSYFLYDDDQLVAEFDSSGVMQASQTWGADGLSYRRTASGASAGNRFYSWDVRANIAATTDATGAVLNTPSSDGFSSAGGTEPCATFGGEVGGYQDAETGLVLFGQRYYDPALGSWLTRDPIAEDGGINLYSYVRGNPTNDADSSGLAGKGNNKGERNLTSKRTGTPNPLKGLRELNSVDPKRVFDPKANNGKGGTIARPPVPDQSQFVQKYSYSIPRIDPHYSNAQTAGWAAAMIAALIAAGKVVSE